MGIYGFLLSMVPTFQISQGKSMGEWCSRIHHEIQAMNCWCLVVKYLPANTRNNRLDWVVSAILISWVPITLLLGGTIVILCDWTTISKSRYLNYILWSWEESDSRNAWLPRVIMHFSEKWRRLLRKLQQVLRVISSCRNPHIRSS